MDVLFLRTNAADPISADEFESRFATLTPAERTVALHVGRGLLNKEVADELSKSLATVKQQMRAVMGKMNICNRGRFIAAMVRYHDPAELSGLSDRGLRDFRR